MKSLHTEKVESKLFVFNNTKTLTYFLKKYKFIIYFVV